VSGSCKTKEEQPDVKYLGYNYLGQGIPCFFACTFTVISLIPFCL